MQSSVFHQNIADSDAVFNADGGVAVDVGADCLCQDAALLGITAGQIIIGSIALREGAIDQRKPIVLQLLHGMGSVLYEKSRHGGVLYSGRRCLKADAIFLAQTGSIRRKAVNGHGDHRVAGATSTAFAQQGDIRAAFPGGNGGVHTCQTAADHKNGGRPLMFKMIHKTPPAYTPYALL